MFLHFKKMYTDLLIDGTALCSVQALGALEYIRRDGQLDELTCMWCYSFGTLIAACMCLHRNIEPLLQFLQQEGVQYMCWCVQNMVKPSVMLPFLRGLNNTLLRSGLRQFIPKHINTLGQLQSACGIKINILVCNVDTMTTEILASDEQPDVPIVDAVLASCALPFIFEPVAINDDVFIDGGTFAGFAHANIQPTGPTLHLSSRGGMCGYGLNVFEQLFTAICSAQKVNTTNTIVLPRYNGVMVYAPPRRLKELYFKGARFAALETCIHRQTDIASARMACCGCSAAIVYLPLPALECNLKTVTYWSQFQISCVHIPITRTKNPMCSCGVKRLIWSTN